MSIQDFKIVIKAKKVPVNINNEIIEYVQDITMQNSHLYCEVFLNDILIAKGIILDFYKEFEILQNFDGKIFTHIMTFEYNNREYQSYTNFGKKIYELKYLKNPPIKEEIKEIYFNEMISHFNGYIDYLKEKYQNLNITFIPSSSKISDEIAGKLSVINKLPLKNIISKNSSISSKNMINLSTQLLSKYSINLTNLNSDDTFILIDDVIGTSASLCETMSTLFNFNNKINFFFIAVKDVKDENKVFINGSISIKKLPQEVKNSIDKIIKQNFEILVGDANGIDTLVQDYCVHLNYFKVTVYSISLIARYKASEKFNFKYIEVPNNKKKERERQQEKDKAMTKDSEFIFTIWDGKSEGSYSNIIRGLDYNKRIKVYVSSKELFLEKEKITKEEIEFIYRENNGYTASEVVDYFKDEADNIFKKTQDLNKYLIQKLIIQKEDNIYLPTNKYRDLFIIDKYHGKIKGIKFKNEFIDWIDKYIKEHSRSQQTSLF